MDQTLHRIWGVLISISIPILLAVGFIRLLLTPLYIQLEYRLPAFPEDPYGFNRSERLKYAEKARGYLVSRQGLDPLRTLTFPGGENLFNERELSHLQDVKFVLRGAFWAWGGAALILALGGWWGVRAGWRERLRAALHRGSWLTLGLVAGVVVLSLLNFQAFFFKFHRVFFEGDTWLFYTSDTLIRLFPLRFWRDAFLFFGVLVAGSAGCLAWLTRD